MGEYEALVNALKASTIPFAEYGWATRPASDFGVVGLDFEAGKIATDNRSRLSVMEGSVDLFLHAKSAEKENIVESILEQHCGASWSRNSIQFEDDTRLLHIEWVFQLSATPYTEAGNEAGSNGA